MRRDAMKRILRRRFLPSGLGAGLLAAGISGTAVAAEEYRLQPGDVVAVSVAGMPDMNLQTPVQIDGTLSLPVVGDMVAGGLTLAEARARIQTAYAGQLLPGLLSDGREVMRTVDRGQVSASVVSYRPVFVSGAVARPGEVAFQPGMTVRQALAVAGGIAQAAPSVTNAISLRADYTEAWQLALAASVRAWRLRQELGETAVDFDVAPWLTPPAPGDLVGDALRVETELRDAEIATRTQEHAYLQQTLKQVDGQLAVLRQQLDIERQSEQSDADDLAIAIRATSKGTYAKSRIAEMRGTALFSATRRLQTESNMMDLERRRTDVARSLARMDETGRLDLLTERRDAALGEVRAHARLESAREALNAAGVAPPGPGAAVPLLSIFREGSGQAAAAGYDSPILPGDVIEIAGPAASVPVAQGGAGVSLRTAAAGGPSKQ